MRAPRRSPPSPGTGRSRLFATCAPPFWECARGAGGGAELELFRQRIFRSKKALQGSGKFPLGPLRLRAPRGGFTKSPGPKPLTHGGGEVAGKMEAGTRPPAACVPAHPRPSLTMRPPVPRPPVSQPASRAARRKGRGEGAVTHDSLVRWRGNAAAPRGRLRPRPGGTAAAPSAEVVSAGVGRGRGGSGEGGAGATAVGPPRPSSSPRRAWRRRAREARGPVSPRRAVTFGSAGTGDRGGRAWWGRSEPRKRLLGVFTPRCGGNPVPLP